MGHVRPHLVYSLVNESRWGIFHVVRDRNKNENKTKKMKIYEEQLQ